MHLETNELIPVVERLFLAPANSPEILPTVLPLIIGALVIELYFGKHPKEKLGWNSSVGNSIIWTATGLTLLVTESLTGFERQAVYSLMGLGTFVGYMNFYHKWPASIAYVVSSSGIVYSMAYALVVIMKTDLVLNRKVIEASLIFVIVINLIFKIIQSFEKPVNNSFKSNI